MSNLSVLNNIIGNRYNTYDVLHRKYGVVKTVLSFARAIVTVEDKDMLELQKEYKENSEQDQSNDNITGIRDLNLLNKTGEKLEVGDAVWVYYWHDISSGYIAIRIGKNKGTDAKVKISRAAVMPSPISNDIYSHAKIYSDTVWNQAISDRTRYIDDNNNLSIQIGGGLSNLERPHFNLFLMNGFPTVLIPFLTDYYHGGGSYSTYNRRYILQHLNMVNSRLFSNKILFSGNMGFNDIYLDPQDNRNGLMTIAGDFRFEVAAYKGRGANRYQPVIKITCDEVAHLVSCGNVYSDDVAQRLPLYDTEQDVLSNVSMIIVSSSTVRYNSISDQTNQVGIAIRARKQDGTYGWGLINTRRLSSGYNLGYITANFATVDEYWYCICVTGG